MANNSNTAVGGALGGGLAILLIAAVAGTPFYLAQLRSGPRSLDDAVQPDIETIRRAVLSLDQNLSALRDLRGAAGEDGVVSADLVAALEEANPNLYQPAMAALDARTNLLRAAVRNDEERGTVIEGGAIASGKPNGRQAVADMASKHLAEAERILRSARAAATRLRATRVGDEAASSHLGANRVLALLSLAEARLHANTANFSRNLARNTRAAANKRLPDAFAFRRAGDRVVAEQPAATLAKIGEDLDAISNEIALLDQGLAGLKAVIANRAAVLADRERAIASAQGKIDEIEAAGFTPKDPNRAGAEFAVYRADYDSIVVESRAAKAEAAAIENGTLQGAELSPEAYDDFLNGAYVGGTPIPGLRDLRERLAQLEERHAARTAQKTALSQRRSALADLGRALDARRSELTAESMAQAEAVTAILDEAARHDAAAATASGAAEKSLGEAGRATSAALLAASAWKRRAAEAAAGGGEVKNAFQDIVADKDVEATLHAMAGEIAYMQAQLKHSEIGAMQAQSRAEAAVAEATGDQPPASIDDDLEALRNDAVASIERSIKSYKSAASAIRSARVTTSAGTFTGDQYEWQFDVALASVRLLQAQLADAPEAAFDARKAAYDALVKAAQKRERSPLLSTAVDTLLYLQTSAQ